MTSVALAGVLTQWQAIRVAMARRKYGVSYPTVGPAAVLPSGMRCLQGCAAWSRRRGQG